MGKSGLKPETIYIGGGTPTTLTAPQLDELLGRLRSALDCSEIKEFTAQMTLERMLEELHIKDQVMAAAVNMQIVKQNEWVTYKLSDGDKIELLDFVGGG